MKKRQNHNKRATEGNDRLKGFLLAMGVAMPCVWIYMVEKRMWLWSLPLSVIIFIMAVAVPARLSFFLKPVEWLNKTIGHFLAFIGFIAIITPMAWMFRLVRGDIISLQFKHKCRSYWLSPSIESESATIDFNKQF